MAGIFGGIGFNDRLDLTRSLNTLAAHSQQDIDVLTESSSFESSAVGIACPDHYALSHFYPSQKSEYAVAVFGNVFVDGYNLKDNNFEDLFYFRFLDSPNALLRSLDGTFAIALVSNDECILINDPFGTFATHYTEFNGAFLFSSQMDALRRIRNERELDHQGLNEYIGLGMTLNGRTPFNNIFRLPAGSILRANRNGVKIERYHVPRYQATDDKASNLRLIREAFETSVSRLSKYPNTIAAMTGGFDSRATWSALLNQKAGVPAHTHGLPNCTDLNISKRISDRYSIPHDILPFDNEFVTDLPNHWRDVIRLSEGGVAIAHTPTFQAFKYLSGTFNILIDSYGGAFYRRQRMKLAELRIDTRKDLVPQILRFEQSPLHSSSLLKPEAKTQILAASENALREYYDSITDTPLLGDKLDRFHFEQVDAMKDSLAANAQMNFIGIAHPFMTRHAIDLAMQLPLSVRRRNEVHKYIVHLEFPALERFTMDNTGLTLPYRGFTAMRYVPMIAERGLQLAANVAPGIFGNLSLRRPTMDVEHLLRPALSKVGEIALSPHPVYDSFIDRTEVERMITLFEKRQTNGAALIQLISLRLFLDLFA